jgi:hypothetical protein
MADGEHWTALAIVLTSPGELARAKGVQEAPNIT